jgi:hypothetical protein
MECYFFSRPGEHGHRGRFFELYHERNGYAISEQNLADRARYILKKGKGLTSVELEEIKRRVLGEESTSPSDGISESQDAESFHLERSVDLPSELDLTTAQRELRQQLIKEMTEVTNLADRPGLPNLKRWKRGKVAEETAAVNQVIGTIEVDNITQVNDLMYAGAKVVAQRLGAITVPKRNKGGSNKPPWRRRMERNIQIYRKDLARIMAMKEMKSQSYLNKKYEIIEKGTSHVMEMLKQISGVHHMLTITKQNG